MPSLQDSSYGVPVGTVIAWPVGTAPAGIHKDHWLDCDGKEFDTQKYPRLYKVLGQDHVPDYQGMFLRGLGSQNYSQHNGAYHGTTSTTYRSGDLGATQGDAIRNISGSLGPQAGGGSSTASANHWNESTYSSNDNSFYTMPSTDNTHNWTAPMRGSSFVNGGFPSRDMDDPYWYDALTKYDYDLNIEYEETSGIRYVSGISVIKKEVHPQLYFVHPIMWMNFDANIQVPTAGENRPVNKAVRYMIKAK